MKLLKTIAVPAMLAGLYAHSLAQGYTITGEVRNPIDVVVPDADVKIIDLFSPTPDTIRTRTDASGKFKVTIGNPPVEPPTVDPPQDPPEVTPPPDSSVISPPPAPPEVTPPPDSSAVIPPPAPPEVTPPPDSSAVILPPEPPQNPPVEPPEEVTGFRNRTPSDRTFSYEPIPYTILGRRKPIAGNSRQSGSHVPLPRGMENHPSGVYVLRHPDGNNKNLLFFNGASRSTIPYVRERQQHAQPLAKTGQAGEYVIRIEKPIVTEDFQMPFSFANSDLDLGTLVVEMADGQDPQSPYINLVPRVANHMDTLSVNFKNEEYRERYKNATFRWSKVGDSTRIVEGQKLSACELYQSDKWKVEAWKDGKKIDEAFRRIMLPPSEQVTIPDNEYRSVFVVVDHNNFPATPEDLAALKKVAKDFEQAFRDATGGKASMTVDDSIYVVRRTGDLPISYNKYQEFPPYEDYVREFRRKYCPDAALDCHGIDFITLIARFSHLGPDESEWASFHSNRSNHLQRKGPVYDISLNLGFKDLLGINYIKRGSAADINVYLHETGHQWIGKETLGLDPLMGWVGDIKRWHYSPNVINGNDVMGGSSLEDWILNPDSTYTHNDPDYNVWAGRNSGNKMVTYSPLTRYFMGLIEKGEVGPLTYLGVPCVQATQNLERKDYTFSELINNDLCVEHRPGGGSLAKRSSQAITPTIEELIRPVP